MKIATTIFIASISAFATETVNLGNFGENYPIEEINFMVELKDNWEKVDKVDLQRQAQEAVNNATKIKTDLTFCKAYNKREFVPTYTLQTPLGAPELGFYYPTGYTFNKLELMAQKNVRFDYKMYFLDSTEPFHLELVKKDQKGLIFLGNGDIKDVYKALQREAFTGAEHKEFGVECLPSIVTQVGNKFVIEEFDYETLKRRYSK